MFTPWTMGLPEGVGGETSEQNVGSVAVILQT